MRAQSRRSFLQHGSMGLTLVGTGAFSLPLDAQATEGSGSVDEYVAALKGFSSLESPTKWQATEEGSEGPFFRRNAPFRGKITAPGETGTILLIGGRIWGLNTRAPLRNSMLDIWQASAGGRHDNDAAKATRDVFLNRARLIADETGWYEFETIKPGPYRTPAGVWQPSRIHYRVQYPGYRALITQIYFKGDPHQEEDKFVQPSLIVDLKEHKVGKVAFKTGRFDIVLEPLQ